MRRVGWLCVGCKAPRQRAAWPATQPSNARKRAAKRARAEDDGCGLTRLHVCMYMAAAEDGIRDVTAYRSAAPGVVSDATDS